MRAWALSAREVELAVEMLKIPCVGQVQGVLWEPLLRGKCGRSREATPSRGKSTAWTRSLWSGSLTPVGPWAALGLRSGALGQGARRRGPRAESRTLRLVEYA